MNPDAGYLQGNPRRAKNWERSRDEDEDVDADRRVILWECVPGHRFHPRKSDFASPMVFALGTKDGGLRAYADARAAEAGYTGIEVEDRAWLFFSDDGSPLEAHFERPNRRGAFTVSGTYQLQRALSGRWLQERIAEVKSVEGCGITTIDEIVELLKVNRGTRAAEGPKRG